MTETSPSTLEKEIADLEQLLADKKRQLEETKISTATQEQINNHSSPETKITLFRSMFKGREDVYAKRFESKKTGKSGYQPVCRNEWVKGVCKKYFPAIPIFAWTMKTPQFKTYFTTFTLTRNGTK